MTLPADNGNLILCAGCGNPIPAPDFTTSIELEAKYRKEHPDEAQDEDSKRALVCNTCLERLRALHEGHHEQ